MIKYKIKKIKNGINFFFNLVNLNLRLLQCTCSRVGEWYTIIKARVL